jgi:hypothetical protein
LALVDVAIADVAMADVAMSDVAMADVAIADGTLADVAPAERRQCLQVTRNNPLHHWTRHLEGGGWGGRGASFSSGERVQLLLSITVTSRLAALWIRVDMPETAPFWG